MEPLRELGRLLLFLGLLLVAVGAALVFGARLPFRLGRLPGDIVYRSRNTAFYFPIVTCLVLSVLLTIVLWVISVLRR